ncbi:DUF86 domain-containing protein [Cyanobacterium sp. IPPAS B-1200]|uniref:HepT-like ribonuclease domain-containing protein n=1 Tax=Cyanobacterium sp. IPPAS B-1200 TaxID=1562720 RepID=UPI0008524ADF|nr:HepT-like ribonuclease domain-containing protein [Cyanobacterium sp. IPPAS B-1200]OEJ79156.1 nucleotidyltransferase [Cyanobacterium sp. IPPAS B-1200]
MRDDTERIKDIQEYIEKIEKYVVRGEREFYENELIQTWIIHNLQIIGEASRATSEQFKAKYYQLDWQDMADFRNLIVHEYFRVDLGVVWEIVKNELPKLKQQINDILQDI